MRKLLTITDLTRMSGNRVCIAGIDSDGVCIRPDLPYPGVLQEHLQVDGRRIIKPRAKIEFELSPKPNTEAPHTEDKLFRVDTWRHRGDCDNQEWLQLLNRAAYPSIEDIFEGALQEHKHGLPGEGPRSLGTIRAAYVHDVQLASPYTDSPRPRLRFSDAERIEHDLPIVDLAYREQVDRLGQDWASWESTTLNKLRRAPVLFLRVGLARPWAQMGNRCYLQVTGIYCLPHNAADQEKSTVR